METSAARGGLADDFRVEMREEEIEFENHKY